MRLWVFIIFSFILGFAAQPDSFAGDEKKEVEIVLAYLDSLHMRKLKRDERSWAEGDEIVVTNACGKFEARFNITLSHNDRTRPLTIKGSIGEWCRPPYALSTYYLFLVNQNEVLEEYELLYDSEGNGIIPMTNAELLELEEDYEFVRRPPIKALTHPVYTSEVFDLDFETRNWIRNNESNIKIIKDEYGKDITIYKNGIRLVDLFPENLDWDEY